MRDVATVDLVPDGSARSGGGSPSLRVLSLLVCAYGAGAVLLMPWTFAALLVDYLSLAVRGSVLALAVGLLLSLLFRRAGGPTQFISTVLSRIAFGVAGIALLSIGLAAFSAYKLQIPAITPFVWDGPFDAFDRLLHGGPPWEITHALMPRWLEHLIGAIYAMPWFVYWFGTVGFALFCAREPLRSRYLWSMALTMGLLGTVAATVFASHGPIFYEHFGLSGYEGLAAELHATPYGRDTLWVADYLFGAYSQDAARFGSGISAMPSMHVAIVTLNLCFYATLSRRLGLLAGGYAALIVIGSVHFGWHYAIDAYASLLAVPLIWWVAGRLAGGRVLHTLSVEPAET